MAQELPYGNIYDFGCGDGFYLSVLVDHAPRLIGLEGSAKIPNKLYSWIIHPIDVAHYLTVGPPGNVLCIEVAEHISSERLPVLLDNLKRHTAKGCWLVLTWAVRGQAGTRHISCRDEHEVLDLVTPLGFVFNKSVSDRWREEAGQDLWWFKKSIYIFRKDS